MESTLKMRLSSSKFSNNSNSISIFDTNRTILTTCVAFDVEYEDYRKFLYCN